MVDIPRSNFRLTTSSVALALRAVIGGSPVDLSVTLLKDRSYSFLVCSKPVGLWIYRLRSFSCDDFVLRFFLWRNGGPNWQWEFDAWTRDQEKEWISVAPKKRISGSLGQPGRSYAQAVHSDIPLKSVFDRLKEPLKVHGVVSPATTILVTKAPVIQPAASLKFQNERGNRDPFPKQVLNSNLICGRCLEKGHSLSACVGPFRCRTCMNMGHAALGLSPWLNCQSLFSPPH